MNGCGLLKFSTEAATSCSMNAKSFLLMRDREEYNARKRMGESASSNITSEKSRTNYRIVFSRILAKISSNKDFESFLACHDIGLVLTTKSLPCVKKL